MAKVIKKKKMLWIDREVFKLEELHMIFASALSVFKTVTTKQYLKELLVVGILNDRDRIVTAIGKERWREILDKAADKMGVDRPAEIKPETEEEPKNDDVECDD